MLAFSKNKAYDKLVPLPKQIVIVRTSMTPDHNKLLGL